MSGAGAHPPITPLDPTREPEAIAEAFSPVHARVYALARDGWLAMRRPAPEIAVTTVAWPCAGGFLVASGVRVLEPGWLAHRPAEEEALRARFPTPPAEMAEFLSDNTEGTLTFEIWNWRGERKRIGYEDRGDLHEVALSAWLGTKPAAAVP